MISQDEILRAYAILVGLKDNLPKGPETSDRWVTEFHGAIDKVEKATGIVLTDFRISPSELHKSVSSFNQLSGEVKYRPGLWCKRDILMQKLDSVLIYFSGLQSGGIDVIRFKPPIEKK